MHVATLNTMNDVMILWDSPFFSRIDKLIPGSLSLMNGEQLDDESPFLASSKFFAEMLPWAMFFSSCRATMLTKRVDIIYFIHDSSATQIAMLNHSVVVQHYQFNHATVLCPVLSKCLISFVSLIPYILVLPESSAQMRAAWQLPVSSLLTPIFPSSSRGQGPHAQQTPEPWCLQVIEATRLARQGQLRFICMCTHSTAVPTVWHRLTSSSVNANAVNQQEVFVRYLIHQAGSLKE